MKVSEYVNTPYAPLAHIKLMDKNTERIQELVNSLLTFPQYAEYVKTHTLTGEAFAIMRQYNVPVERGPGGEWLSHCFKCGHESTELNPEYKPTKCGKCGEALESIGA